MVIWWRYICKEPSNNNSYTILVQLDQYFLRRYLYTFIWHNAKIRNECHVVAAIYVFFIKLKAQTYIGLSNKPSFTVSHQCG